MTQLAERPIFIVGNPRSGTTLLRFVLSSHPRIHIPGETGFIPYLLREVEAELSLSQVRAVLERIGRLNRSWSNLIDDVPLFYEALPEPRLAHVLDALYRQMIAGHGAERWGDKTPGYVMHIATLNRIFPTAQFVHLIRDGRDATLSAQAKWGDRRWYMDSYYLLRNWVRSVEQGQEAGRKLSPACYLEVRYEELVGQSERTIRRICAFLGEEPHPAMLDHTRLAREQIEPGGHVEVREPISAASAQRWVTEMSPFDKKLADRIVGPTLSTLGYRLAGLGPFSTSEQLEFTYLSAKYRLTDAARWLLTTLGLLTLNRGKRRR